MIWRERLKQLYLEETRERTYDMTGKISWVHCFPGTYSDGMLNLGVTTIYSLVNQNKNSYCERAFISEKEYENPEILSLESQKRLIDFDAISFSLPYELLYSDMIRMILESGIEPLTKNRKGGPLLIAGGFCATYNPEPIADLFDAIIIGEAEPVLDEIIRILANTSSKSERLQQLCKVPGVYVPEFYLPEYEKGKFKQMKKLERNAPNKITRVWCQNIDDFIPDFIVSKNTLRPNSYFIESNRGCSRHCRFCALGYMYRKPRTRNKDAILKKIKKVSMFCEEIRLISPSEDEHPHINEIFKKARDMGLKVIMGSQRADCLTQEILNLATNESFTIAPEAGSDKLRQNINKTISNAQFIKTARFIAKSNAKEIHLFMIIGFPEETMKDRMDIPELIRNIRKAIDEEGREDMKIVVYVNNHIKKPQTPLQWERQLSWEEYIEKFEMIKNAVEKIKNTVINSMTREQIIVEGILVRGDRRVANIMIDAIKKGNSVDDWIMACYENELDPYLFLEQIPFDDSLPWNIIDTGVKMKFLVDENKKYYEGEKTEPCSDVCKKCGVCNEVKK